MRTQSNADISVLRLRRALAPLAYCARLLADSSSFDKGHTGASLVLTPLWAVVRLLEATVRQGGEYTEFEPRKEFRADSQVAYSI